MLRRKCPLAVVAMARARNQEEAVGRLIDVRGVCQAESVQSMKGLAASATAAHRSDQLKAQRNRRVVFDPEESPEVNICACGKVSLLPPSVHWHKNKWMTLDILQAPTTLNNLNILLRETYHRALFYHPTQQSPPSLSLSLFISFCLSFPVSHGHHGDHEAQTKEQAYTV